MKRYIAYITQGLDPEFDRRILRTVRADDFFAVCRAFLNHNSPLPALPQEESKRFCGFSELLGSPASPAS